MPTLSCPWSTPARPSPGSVTEQHRIGRRPPGGAALALPCGPPQAVTNHHQHTMPNTTSGLARLQRRPVRVTATMPAALHEQLLQRSDVEGRSLSNLIAYLLESAMDTPRPL